MAYKDLPIQEQVNRYCNTLRDSGDFNMFGVGSLIADEFDMGITQARDHLAEWMKTYGKTQNTSA